MIKIELNGIRYWVSKTLTTLEVCNYGGIILPRFCYHETLSVAGNCRMCLVEIANSPKPMVACALPVSHQMQIFTATPLVKKARENVLEVLLLNHPLDCPICDQGGECDLQDQALNYGTNISSFFFKKRAVEDKFCSPVIKTIMTRCIHCTRCVRFGSEIAGVDFLGTLNRGVSTEIGSYINSFFKSEIAGNSIDLCPVGALTNKKYAFTSRPWELRTTESIDLTDSLGSNIYISYKENEILKVIPKTNIEVNDNLITDKARFSKQHTNFSNFLNFEQKNQWFQLLSSFNLKNRISKTLFLIDAELDTDSLILLNQLKNLESSISIRTLRRSSINLNLSLNFLNESILSLLNKPSKFCFILSSNLKIESALLNVKVRRKVITDNLKTFIGHCRYENTFSGAFLNLNFSSCLALLEGKNEQLSRLFFVSPFPLVFVGEAFYQRGMSSYTLVKAFKQIIPSVLLFQVRKFCNSEGVNLFNFKSISTRDLLVVDRVICVNLTDSLKVAKLLTSIKPENVVWFNSVCSKLSRIVSKCIMPINPQSGETNIFFNCEQRPQKTSTLFLQTTFARSIKFFLKCLLDPYTKTTLGFSKRFGYVTFLLKNPQMFRKLEQTFTRQLLLQRLSSNRVSFYPLKDTIQDFYLTNSNSLEDKTLLQVSQRTRKYTTNFIKTI